MSENLALTINELPVEDWDKRNMKVQEKLKGTHYTHKLFYYILKLKEAENFKLERQDLGRYEKNIAELKLRAFD